MTLTVSIIIHDDFSRIFDCLNSLFASDQELEFEVCLIINQGDPAEVDRLRSQFGDIHIIVNETPRGFAANHNHILALADTPYIALLNDDIVIKPGALSTMIAYLDANPRVGLVGPYLLMEDGTPEAAAYSDPTLLRMLYRISGLATLTRQGSLLRRLFVRLGVGRLLQVDSLNLARETREVDIVVGTAMLVRRVAYEQVGYMDESTLAYGEDIDWSYRFRQNGWRVAVVGDATVVHYGSGQVQGQLQGAIFVESQKGMLNFFIKHRPGWQILVLRLSMALMFGLRGLLAIFYSRENAVTYLSTVAIALHWQPKQVP